MYKFSGPGPEYELGLAFQSSAKKDIVVNPLHYIFESVPSTSYGDHLHKSIWTFSGFMVSLIKVALLEKGH